ncbi:FeS assembly ATPase SufC [Hepatocystis sp. ex Piliocolobus tephrosceles]|nr:FeS assembly ATPase SufC [Hepatocystis sp. ex Piliocolobus tephrosceles]
MVLLNLFLIISCVIVSHISMTICINISKNEFNYIGSKIKEDSIFQTRTKYKQKDLFIINKIKKNNLKKSKNSLYVKNDNMDDNRLSLLKNLEKETEVITQAPDWNEKQPLLEISNLYVIEIEGEKEILHGVNLIIYSGERHAIMGRNGSGKSTLAKVIAGHPYYKVTKGSMKFKGLNLDTLPVNVRSLCGIFLAFQYPIELPMIKNNDFLRAALNSHRRQRNETELSASEFDLLMLEEIKKVGLCSEFLNRPVNYGFSGGEKKRNEILQMLILKPSFAILDETDSGLDIDSFKLTSNVLANYANNNNSFLVVTHYKKLLQLLKPNYIHIMHQGKIIETGNYTLVDKIESSGYSQFFSS